MRVKLLPPNTFVGTPYYWRIMNKKKKKLNKELKRDETETGHSGGRKLIGNGSKSVGGKYMCFVFCITVILVYVVYYH